MSNTDCIPFTNATPSSRLNLSPKPNNCFASNHKLIPKLNAHLAKFACLNLSLILSTTQTFLSAYK